MSKSTRIFFFCFLLAALAGCDKLNFFKSQKSPPEKGTAYSVPVKGTVIAKVNNIPVTLEDLNSEIEDYNSQVPEDRPELKITTREQKIKYLKDELVRRVLLYQEALNRGLERNEEVLVALEKSKMNILVLELAKQETEKVDVKSSEIEGYYNDYKEQLKEPEERRIREIVVPAQQEAKDIVAQVYQGADFAALAKERSKAVSSKDGGDLGYIMKGAKFAQFDLEAFSDTLEVGGLSKIFKGPEGYYILKLEDKRGGKMRSLSDMWEDIKRGLTFVKQQQKIDDLVKKLGSDPRFKVEIYEGEIK